MSYVSKIYERTRLIHFLLSPYVDRPTKIMRSTIKASKGEALLGVRIDRDLTFKEHVMSMCALKLIKNFMH